MVDKVALFRSRRRSCLSTLVIAGIGDEERYDGLASVQLRQRVQSSLGVLVGVTSNRNYSGVT